MGLQQGSPAGSPGQLGGVAGQGTEQRRVGGHMEQCPRTALAWAWDAVQTGVWREPTRLLPWRPLEQSEGRTLRRGEEPRRLEQRSALHAPSHPCGRWGPGTDGRLTGRQRHLDGPC